MADTPIVEDSRNTRFIELRQKIHELDSEILSLTDLPILDEAQEERYADLCAERDAIEPEFTKLETRAERAQQIQARTYRELKGMPEFRKPHEELFGADVRKMDIRAARDGALRILNDSDSNYVLSSPAGDFLEKTVRKDTDLARRIIVTENDHYRSAWHRLLVDPSAAAYISDEERLALRRVMEYRTASSTVGAGGYAIPVFIDPSIILTDQETDNPFFTVARQVDVNTNTWKGVSSAGMSWSFDAEAAEVSDDSLTSIAQPSVSVFTARGFIPYTIEIGEDWPGFQEEMARLLTVGYDELLISKFTNGVGSTVEPEGIVTKLISTGAAVYVTSQTDGQFGSEDVYATWSALAQKYRRRASWMMSVDIQNKIRQMGTSTQFHAFSVDITQGGIPTLFNKPVYENAYMSSFSSTTGSANRLIVGDFSNYLVAKRRGMEIELVPHLTSTGNNRPNGTRGWFATARIGGGVVNTSAFKIQINT
jgi:HK97 family phage major capsid protein